jgi:rod shape-determining protein MreB
MAFRRQPARAQERRLDALGTEAKLLQDRVPPGMELINPKVSEAGPDATLLGQMLHAFLARVHLGTRRHPRMLVGMPAAADVLACRAVREAARLAGAREVLLINESTAAALGAGLDVTDRAAVMMVDIGASGTRATIHSMSRVFQCSVGNIGGTRFDTVVANHLAERHNLLISSYMAEEIKKQLTPSADAARALQIRGHCLTSGLPRCQPVPVPDLVQALSEAYDEILQLIKTTLLHAAPELAAEISERGLLLTGGGALLPGLAQHLAQATGVPVQAASEPSTCVIRGAGLVLSGGKRHVRLITQASDLDGPAAVATAGKETMPYTRRLAGLPPRVMPASARSAPGSGSPGDTKPETG